MNLIRIYLLLLLTASCSHSLSIKDQSRALANETGSLNVKTWAKFGPEWTFTRYDIDGGTIPDFDIFEEWWKEIEKKCQTLGCRTSYDPNVSTNKPQINVYFDRDFKLKILGDPSVFEVNTTPLTLDSLSRYEDKIQKVIFDTADVIDLVPDDRIGGGHLHFDVFTHFEGNQKLIRNFIVDIMNNPELFMGPLGFDPLNAPPLAILSKEQQNMFVSALKKFDEGYIDIHELVKIIRDDVYRISFVAIDDVRPQRYYLSNQSKFQLLNLNNFPKTIELRGFRPQRNMVDQRALMEIFATRIAYLQQGNQLIDYHPQDLRGRITYTFDRLQDIHNYTLQHPSDRIAASFNRYLLETGMDPAKYHFLLPTNLQNLAKNPAINCVLNY